MARTRTKNAAPVPEKWQSRIIDHGDEDPEQLLANPRNFRIHPKAQQDALEKLLDTVGWVQDVIVNKTTGHVVDGHMRIGLALSKGEASIPVSYVELSEAEEKLMLAALDPISAMAVTDEGALKGLLSDLGNAESLDDLLAELSGNAADANSTSLPTQEEIDRKQKQLDAQMQGRNVAIDDVICPECGHEFTVSGESV